MNDINRRDVPKGLVASPTKVTMGSPCANVTPRVNIVLHGMQVLVFDQTNQRLLILVPNVPDHAFGVGDFRLEQPIGPSSTANPHILTNVKGGNNGGPKSGSTDNVVINWSKSTKYGEDPYCVFDLPWPDCLVPLRVHQTGTEKLFLPGTTVTDNNLDAVTSVPMVNLLSYTNVTDISNVVLAGVKLTPDGNQVVHAHIIAEPVFEMPGAAMGMHANRAFAMLNIIFEPPLDLRINQKMSSVPPTPVSTEPGVKDEELYTLGELRQKGAGRTQLNMDGGHPRNCMQVFVTMP